VLQVDLLALDEETLREVVTRQAEMISALNAAGGAPGGGRGVGGVATAVDVSTTTLDEGSGDGVRVVRPLGDGVDSTADDVPMARHAVVYEVDHTAARAAEAEANDACTIIIFVMGFFVFVVWWANLFMLCKETTKRGKVGAT
jgi:hypothetical protein